VTVALLEKPSVRADIQTAVDQIGDNWIVRTSTNGIGYGGYKHADIGVWAKAPDWNPEPVCGGGFHGQGPGGFGHAQAGTRFEFCATRGGSVVVDGNKRKVEEMCILFAGADAYAALAYACRQDFPGSLDLRGCDLTGITLPTSVGGSLYLSGATNVPKNLPPTKAIR